MDTLIEKLLKVLKASGVVIGIITLAVFMFTASSVLFTLMAGVGIASMSVIVVDYIEMNLKLKDIYFHKVIMSYQDSRTFNKLKELYAKEHPDSLIDL